MHSNRFHVQKKEIQLYTVLKISPSNKIAKLTGIGQALCPAELSLEPISDNNTVWDFGVSFTVSTDRILLFHFHRKVIDVTQNNVSSKQLL